MIKEKNITQKKLYHNVGLLSFRPSPRQFQGWDWERGWTIWVRKTR